MTKTNCTKNTLQTLIILYSFIVSVMKMEKSLDEKVYLVTVLSEDNFKPDKIEAYGVKIFDEDEDYLVGVFNFMDRYNNPKKFLKRIARQFGEANLHLLPGETSPGLVCRMQCKGPEYNIGVLLDDSKDYRNIKLDLLEMRASDPKPILSLKYNLKKNTWDYKPVLPDDPENVHALDDYRS